MWTGFAKYFLKYAPCFWGVPLYLFLQFFWHSVLEHRDYPGPAGTLSIYRALRNDQGTDWVARNLQMMMQWGLNVEEANHLLSIGAGTLAIVGISLFTLGLSTIRAAQWAGVLAAVWSLSQYFGILTGMDTLAFGIAWFSLGLLGLGFRLGLLGWPFLGWGIWLFPWAVGVKSTVMPLLIFCGFSVFSHRRSLFWLILSLPLLWFIGEWSASYFWPGEHAMVHTPSLNRRTLEYGFFRLQELPKRGLSEGRFVGLWQIALLCHCTWSKNFLWRIVLLVGFGMAFAFVSAGLGEFIRPRYLAPMGFGIFVALGIGVVNFRYGAILGWLLLGSLFLDSWGFFYQWSKLRKDMIGGSEMALMEPPSILQKWYLEASDLTVRDLSMTGAVELLDYWQGKMPKQGIAIPRLRDDRQRTVMAFAAMADVEVVVLDPGRCCAGSPVNQYCAQRVLKQLAEHQFLVALPLPLKGIERMQGRDVTWRDDLIVAAQQLPDLYQGEQGEYWSFQHVDPSAQQKEGALSTLPCQFDLKMGDRKPKKPPSPK